MVEAKITPLNLTSKSKNNRTTLNRFSSYKDPRMPTIEIE